MSAIRIAPKVKAIQGKQLKLANELLKESNIHKINRKQYQDNNFTLENVAMSNNSN